MGLQLSENLDGQVCRGAGRDRDIDTEGSCFINQVKQVSTPQRIATGEDQVWRWFVEGRDLMEKLLPFLVGQFVRMRSGDRFRAAVTARQPTRLRHLPIDQHGISGIVVAGRVMRMH